MTSIPAETDVLVVGGGPAGSIAASRLAQRGVRVVLLEKARHPRPIVGESLIPHFWKFTDAIGATEAIEAEGFVAKSGGLAFWQDRLRQLRFSDFDYDRPALHVERDRFDEILLNTARAAGAEIFEEVTVLRLDDDLKAPVAHYRHAEGELGSIRARFVIDASGQSAVLAKQLGIREFDPDLRFTSLWGYYEGGSYVTVAGDVHPFSARYDHRPATLTSTIGDWGWVWHIVLRDQVSVGVVLPPERLQQFKAAGDDRASRFQALVRSSPIVGDLTEGAEFVGRMHGLRDYAYKPLKLAAGHCYMAGDAAAFVDPINSAGVVFAMYAGFAAAWSIERSLHTPDRSEEFRDTYCQLYGQRLSLFRLLALPSDAEGVERAKEAAQSTMFMTSSVEQQLMLLQATLNSRSEGIRAVLEEMGFPSDVACKEIPIPTFA